MASSAFFYKPELALRRALELSGIQQHEAALSLLHEILSGPRRQRTWSPAFEQIMMAYLDLCLKLFKTREAKDGLHQYRNLSQSQAPGSLEKVIRHLMDKALAQCQKAQAAVDQATLAQTTDTEDELGATPEAILLSTMAMDPAKSQRDSALLLPTLKFLWETYRAILDILRSSSKLEHVYHAAAQQALLFCQTYNRRVEFRHLTDMLRTHLGNLRQYGSVTAENDESRSNHKVRGWEGWTTESIELHLQTRFCQLETASVLHRYTEGFRTCEDIFNILQISQSRRKADPDIPPPKAKLMASYYERLTTLFWVSENYLFHAFAWYKYYSLYKEFNRGMSDDLKRTQASAVLLATLCIPSLPASHRAQQEKGHGIGSTAEDDMVKHKMARMATLLGFHTRNPTREALLAELKSKNLLEQVPAYLRELYHLLEENSDPLQMIRKAQPLLEKLKQEVGITNDSDKDNVDVTDTSLGRYVEPLTQVLLLKLIVNLSKAYHTVSIDFLQQLTTGLGMSFEQIEKNIVVFTQTKTLTVRIDHRAGCLRFGSVQLESDGLRSQLTTLAKRLTMTVSESLEPIDPAIQVQRQAVVFDEIRTSIATEHAAVLERKSKIEQRKELEERKAQEKILQAQRIKAAEEAARRKEEELRMGREQRLREQEKLRKIQQEMETQEKKRVLQAMGKNVEEISEQQMASIDTVALQKEHQAKLNKKKEDGERKTRESAKRLDYLVRAVRIEELPLVQNKYEEKIKKEREQYEQENVVKAQKAREQWEADVKAKQAMEQFGVFNYMNDFQDKVLAGRKAAHALACQEAERVAEMEAEEAKFNRARKRKDEDLKREEEEIARAKEEEELREREVQDRLKEEARREREEKEEERRKVELQRMDEERQRKEQAGPARPSAGGGPGGGGGGSRYVPPSMRNRGGGGPGGGGGSNRFGGGGGGDGPSRSGESYPGGGRYDGRGGGERTRDGGGGDDGGRFGDRRGYDDRGGGGGGRDGGGGGGAGGSSENSRWR